MTTTEPRPHESQEDREVATAGRLRAIAATQQSPDRHGIQPADVDSRAGARPIAPPQLAAPRSPPSRAIAQQRAARPALPGRKFASLGCTRANALISAAEDASTITALERICARARGAVSASRRSRRVLTTRLGRTSQPAPRMEEVRQLRRAAGVNREMLGRRARLLDVRHS
jgi:hypothetical protein